MDITQGGSALSESLDQFALTSMPHFIAVQYRRMMDARCAEDKVRAALRVYEVGLRLLALSVVSQYLGRDSARPSNAELNDYLKSKLPHATLGLWQSLLRLGLKAYRGHQSLLFIPELYDLYWDRSADLHVPRTDVDQLLTRLTQICSELEQRQEPEDEDGWQSLCDEVMALLRQVMSYFTFFQEYELIRILKREGNRYWYESHTGLEIRTFGEPLETDETLEVDQVYLSKEQQDFLRMHPLLITWKDVPHKPDVAVYEKSASDDLFYLAVPVWQTFPESAHFNDFYAMLFVIDVSKRERETREPLSWWKLKDVARTIREKRMAAVERRYRSELYLQREATKKSFEDFLKSDKVGFVLVGQSGVGKSSFVLALDEEYSKYQSNVCLLMYHGANLDAAESLTSVVSKDVRRRDEGQAEESSVSIWHEIDRIQAIEERQVVLVIDAINENPQASELLRKVDELVANASWPWLKVVVTSRPEAWRNITPRHGLAETRYYWPSGEETPVVTIDRFSYSEELEPFKRDELPQVYEKYQSMYQLKTAYEDLSPGVRRALQDPLSLLLVAETYSDGELPPTITPSEVIEKYIDGLVRTGRLHRNDLQFLTQQLVPLMIGEGHYAPAITSRQVGDVWTSDGKRLHSLIHEDVLLSDGRRVNQSYVNLADAGILVRDDTGWRYTIRFRHERFYDYFAGERVFELASKSSNSQEYYHVLAGKVRGHPFLWGAVVRSLLRELGKEEKDPVVQLAKTQDNMLKDLVVAALVQYGEGQPEAVNEVLGTLLAQDTDDSGGSLTKWLPMLGRDSLLSPDEEMVKRIAIEVASKLSIPWVLERAAMDPHASVRAMAVKHVFYLSRSSPSDSMQVLKDLGGKVILRWRIPNRHVLESCAVISLLLFFSYADDSLVIEEIKRVWKEILGGLLPFSSERKTWWGRAAGQAQGWLFSVAVRILVRVAATFEESEAMIFSIKEIRAFWRGKEVKATYEKLVPYLDVEYGSIAKAEKSLVQSAEENDQLTLYLVTAIVAAHSIREKEVTLKVADQVFHAAMSPPTPTSYVPGLLLALSIAVYSEAGGVDGDLWKAYESYVERFYQKSHNRCAGGSQNHWWTEQSRYLMMFYEQYGHTDSPIVREFLRDIEARKEWMPLRLYIAGMAEHTARFGFRAAYLEQLLTFLEHKGEDIPSSAIDALARIRTYYRLELDEFLDYYDVDPAIQQMIRARETGENFGNLLVRSGYQFGRDKFIIAPEEGTTQHVVWFFGRAAQVDSLEEWLSDVGKYMFNLIYGGPLFPLG